MPRTAAPQLPDLTGLVAWWRFRNGDLGTTTLTDDVGNLNLTITGANWKSANNNYLAFTGTNSGHFAQATVAAASPLDFSGATSISIVLRLASLGNGGNANGRVIETKAFGIIPKPGSTLVILNLTGIVTGNYATALAGMGTGVDDIVCLTYDSSVNTLKLIVNGVVVSTDTTHWSGVFAAALNANLMLGGQYDQSGNSGFNGNLLDVAIFKNRVLTAAESQNLMLARKTAV